MNRNKRRIYWLATALLAMFFSISAHAQIKPITNLNLTKLNKTSSNYVPLYQWYSPSRGDNFLTTNPKWAGKKGDKKSPDYRFVRIEGYILSPTIKQPANTVAVYSWYNHARGDNFITANANYNPAKKVIAGYSFVRKEGYIYTKSATDRISLQSHYSPGRKDNFASAHSYYRGTIGKKTSPDYRLYRTEGYVIDPTKIGKYNTKKIVLNPKIYKRNNVLIKKDTSKRIIDTKGLKSIGLVKYYPIYTGNKTTVNTERQGPNITKFEDIETLLSESEFESFFEKLNVFRKIYEDKNPKSNYYYYLPSTYTLKWNKDNGKYAFNIFYLSSDNSEKGAVLIKAELTPHISKEDIQLAEEFFKKKMGKPIKLMPLDLRDVPTIDFGSTLENFNVKPESVSVSIPSDFLKPIIVDWKMESNVDDFVGAMLNNIGVNTNIDFKPYGDEERIISVPVNLQVNDPITLGKIDLESPTDLLNGWNNYLDYPVVLNQIVLLRQRTNKTKYLETISLNSEQIEPSATFSLVENTLRNKLVQGDQINRMWIDYSITDCNSCNQKVKEKIIGGTSGSQITNLEVQILNLLEFTEAHSFKLLIRSIQADPNALNMVNFPAININEDDQSFSGGKFFIPEGKELYYEYQLIMIMPTGEVTTSPWKKGNNRFLVIGEYQLETIFKEDEKTTVKDANDLDSVKDSLINKGKKLLEDLFKKKKDKDKDKE